ncbi:halocyanin domain-containing protein [Halomicrobium salinisoli]|uniref:halocyanin domain-containing protein n=1 Tax=Halomicrobium salinisoli TaxID=2878391 RepID=UPI001CF0B92F|nr:halocyanin domain-containing protein [Halomicrobium salinisoli]
MNRREFVRTAGGVAGGTAALSASGAAAAQEGGNESGGGGGGGTPDFGGFLDGVGNFDGSVTDATGQDSATVEVGVQANGGAYGFGPAAIHVDNGATVQWEWTGEGGGHNVVSDGDGPLDSDTYSESGVHYEQTFEEDGIYPYVCEPHQSLGMKGAVVVGTDYATAGGDGEGSVETLAPEEAGVPIQPHFVGIATGLAIIVSLIFTFFTLKYGESPHTSGGND